MRLRLTVVVLLSVALFLFGGCDNDSSDPIGCVQSTGTPFDNVKVIDQETVLNCVENNGSHNLTLAPSFQEINENDIIVAGVSTRHPHGFIQRVHRVTNNADGTLSVGAEPAGLGDVFKELNICHQDTLTSDDIVEESGASGTLVPGSAKRHNLFNFSYPIDETFAHDLLHMEGSVDFNIGYNINIRTHTKVDWHGVHVTLKNGTKFTVDAGTDANIRLWAGKEFSGKKEKTLYRAQFNPIVIDVAGIPVVFVPVLTIIGGVTGDVVAEVTTDASASIEGVAGIEYHNHWKPIKDLHADYDYNPPQLMASASIKAYAGPKLTLKIYDLTGPYAYLFGYGRIHADVDADPWWSFHVGAESRGGFYLKALHHTLVNKHMNIFSSDHTIAKASGPFNP